jgi:hypothetical protein
LLNKKVEYKPAPVGDPIEIDLNELSKAALCNLCVKSAERQLPIDQVIVQILAEYLDDKEQKDY